MDPFRRVATRERVRIPARTWNGILETVEAFQRPYALGAGELFNTADGPGVILAKNTTDDPIDRYRVVGFDELVLDGEKFGFLERKAIEARLPTADDHTVFGVTQEILRPDQFGRVMIFGVTYLRVDVQHDDDEYAEVEVGEHVAKSTPLGPIQLLKNTPGGTAPEERWCIARVGHLQTVTGIGKATAEITAGTLSGKTAEIYKGPAYSPDAVVGGEADIHYSTGDFGTGDYVAVTWYRGKRYVTCLVPEA